MLEADLITVNWNDCKAAVYFWGGGGGCRTKSGLLGIVGPQRELLQ